MGILVGLIQQIRYWDAASKWALAIAVSLLLLALLMLSNGPAALRDAALIGVVGLLIVIQMIFLWGNRHLVTPYTQAQRHFIAGDFAAARDTLLAHLTELEQQGKRPDADIYVLLGNAYRNLSDLDESEQVLTKALQLQPTYHFPLYGFGRTLLAQGAYQGAVDVLQRALQHGAPAVAQFDLGHAYYRLGTLDEAKTALLAGLSASQQEPHRELMTRYLLQKLAPDAAQAPDAQLIEAGLPFWRAESQRFADTPFGQALQADIRAMQAMHSTDIDRP